MIDETYRLALSESSKLKLRALAVRAEGGEDASYRAAVLFDELVGEPELSPPAWALDDARKDMSFMTRADRRRPTAR